jgi:hypothetical protein
MADGVNGPCGPLLQKVSRSGYTNGLAAGPTLDRPNHYRMRV